MIGAFINYFVSVVNYVINLMGNLYIKTTSITVLSIVVATMFVVLSVDIIEGRFSK